MLCAVPSRLPKMRGDINVKDAGRDASCLSDTSPRRAGDRSADRVPLGRAPPWLRADLLGVLPVRTSRHRCGGRLDTPICNERDA